VTKSANGLSLNLERIAIGILAADGLVTAACISALPSAPCAAIAETYLRSIEDFGVGAIWSALTVATMISLQSDSDTSLARWFRKAFSAGRFIMLFYCVWGFWGASVTGTYNLRTATSFCFVGSDAELVSHRHKRIQLLDADRWWKISPQSN
jgi:hypothetical protein